VSSSSLTRSIRYLHLDVFTASPFEGNQLAVFPAPGDLTGEQMQVIAREMNFSESTFILPAEGDGDVRMRIFTPGSELPIAGHPTIGSTFALVIEGVIAPGRRDFVFELGVGPTPVTLDWDGDALSFAWMTMPLPTFGATIENRGALARAMGVAPEDLAGGLPAQLVSCGVPYVLVPMTSRAAVDAVSIERQAFARCCREAGIDETPVFFFTTDGGTPGETAYSRMVAPAFGIAEDPATGSASGPLGCYLVQHGVVTADRANAIVSLQGVGMGRPSRIHIAIDGDAGRITRVRVGGQAVLVGRGELTV
jgi:trans-2,3-dihydro-3-hydroxyanthranilate isomerase